MAWAFQLHPAREELLSGYLARVAHAHGSVAGAFCRRHLGDSWFFTRDVDRGVADSQHDAVASLAGISRAEVSDMTLRQWADALTPMSYRRGSVPAVVPWINAVGIKQARRRHRALPFCPACLNEHGVVLRRWRLGFHTWCAEHMRPLSDACLRCSAAFVPHLARGSLVKCHGCGGGLRQTVKVAADSLVRSASVLQGQMDGWLSQAVDGDIGACDRLAGLRVLVSVGLLGNSGRTAREAQWEHRPTELMGGRFEVQPLLVRVQAMGWLARMLDDWPHSFRRLASISGLSQRSFARSPIGGWLKAEVHRLPSGTARRRGRSVAILAAALRGPENGDGANWRAKRAEMLMRRVGGHGH
jgi:hypothetical protein